MARTRKDYIIGNQKRLTQVVKWYRESANQYNKRNELRQIKYHYNKNTPENLKQATEKMQNLTQYFINAYNSNGLIRIGYLLQKNINKFGKDRVNNAIMINL